MDGRDTAGQTRSEKDFWIKGFRVTESVDENTGRRQILVYDVSALSPYGFDLKGTFESGQCFRWKIAGENRYAGIVRGRAVAVSLIEGRHLRIENANAADFAALWHDYFDLSARYHPILEEVDKDPFLHEAVRFAGGVRLLRQDFEEVLFSYILSAQNNIPRIKKLVENLCETCGEPVMPPEGATQTGEASGQDFTGYAFPSADALARSFCRTTRPDCAAGNLCRTPFGGYRCPYIRGTALSLSSGQTILDPAFLASAKAAEARRALCRLPGVGEKIADCVLLYSGLRRDICPIDRWVEKTIRSVYLAPDASIKEIRAFTESYFGVRAGYAQLWFFYYVRNLSSGSDASLLHL